MAFHFKLTSSLDWTSRYCFLFAQLPSWLKTSQSICQPTLWNIRTTAKICQHGTAARRSHLEWKLQQKQYISIKTIIDAIFFEHHPFPKEVSLMLFSLKIIYFQKNLKHWCHTFWGPMVGTFSQRDWTMIEYTIKKLDWILDPWIFEIPLWQMTLSPLIFEVLKVQANKCSSSWPFQGPKVEWHNMTSMTWHHDMTSWHDMACGDIPLFQDSPWHSWDMLRPSWSSAAFLHHPRHRVPKGNTPLSWL